VARKKGFHNAPFKNLKGASLFPEQRPAEPAPSPPPPVEEEEPDFYAAMEQLGVTPARPESAPGTGSRHEQDAVKPSDEAFDEADETLFLEQLGRFDKRFRDELPAESGPEQASPRRQRQLRRGRIAPEAELDLHGSDRSAALARLGHFLDNAGFHGLGCVLVITGRGNRSAGEPVLRSAVEQFLADPGHPLVAEWVRAPRQYGGEGALVLFLRRGTP